MITVFFNETGYYVVGGGIEIAQSCPPALTESGSPVFLTIHHTYWMLFRALKEIQGKKSQDDVMVYNDSRIIEEMNGVVEPFDDTCDRWQKAIRRNVLPSIRSCVLFRKKPATFVAENVAHGQHTLIRTLSVRERTDMMDRYVQQLEIRQKRQLARKAQRFRESHRSEDLKEKWYS
jgi:hypothetical protein